MRRFATDRLTRAAADLMARLRALRGEPHHVARGAALGAFVAFAVPPGAQTVLAIGTAPLLRSDPVAAALFVWITNPLTMPFLYPFAFRVGRFICGVTLDDILSAGDDSASASTMAITASLHMMRVLYTGMLFTGCVAAAASFALTYWLVSRWRRMGHSA